MQLLEGKKKAIDDMYENIKQDPRHKKQNIILEGRTKDRLFKDWWMGFETLTPEEFTKMTGFKKLDETTFADEDIQNKNHPALIFLKLFYEKHSSQNKSNSEIPAN